MRYQYMPHGGIQIVNEEGGVLCIPEDDSMPEWREFLAVRDTLDVLPADPLPESVQVGPSQNDQLAAMGRAHAQTIRDAIAANDLKALGTATADALVAMSDILMKSQGIGVDSGQSDAG